MKYVAEVWSISRTKDAKSKSLIGWYTGIEDGDVPSPPDGVATAEVEDAVQDADDDPEHPEITAVDVAEEMTVEVITSDELEYGSAEEV